MTSSVLYSEWWTPWAKGPSRFLPLDLSYTCTPLRLNSMSPSLDNSLDLNPLEAVGLGLEVHINWNRKGKRVTERLRHKTKNKKMRNKELDLPNWSSQPITSTQASLDYVPEPTLVSASNLSSEPISSTWTPLKLCHLASRWMLERNRDMRFVRP